MAKITDTQWAELLRLRASKPNLIFELYKQRKRRVELLTGTDPLFLIAADHPARGDIEIRSDSVAMASRRSLLDRMLIALANPAVDGMLGSPDIVEDLLLLGEITGNRFLDDRLVIGSMNRGGLAGADWTIDDRFTAYTAESIVNFGLDGGKMLLRIVDTDSATAPTIEACAKAVSDLASARVMAMVEPLPYEQDGNGQLHLLRDSASLARAACVGAGLGHTSAFTWLKMPASSEPEIVYGATTLPSLVLGGKPERDFSGELSSWGDTLLHPAVRGLIVGRVLLYPADGDVEAAVASASSLLANTTT